MAELETEGDQDVSFEVNGRRVSVDGPADEVECAALACAVASHLRDEARARAEAAEEASAGRDRYASPVWKLSGRLDVRRRCALPQSCPSGSEWKQAGRNSVW
jgi:hypothetical protein